MAEAIISAAVAVAGGFAGRRLKLPAGFMLGALLASGLLNVLWPAAAFPPEARILAQIVAGAYIGMNVTRASLRELQRMLAPALVLFGGVTFFAIASGFAIVALTGMPLATAMLSTVPGGIVDMSMISLEFGAQPQTVAILQLERLILIMSIYPFILKKIIAAQRSKLTSDQQASTVLPAVGSSIPTIQSSETRKDSRWKELAITLLIAALAGLLFWLIGVPAGALVGAMAAAAIFNILSDGRAYVSNPVKCTAQITAGLLIGMNVDAQSLLDLRHLALPALVVLLECAAIGGALGWLLWKKMRVDLATALFGSAPAGLSDMVLIAIDEGGDPSKVMLLQLVRYIGVISLFPILIKLLISN